MTRSRWLGIMLIVIGISVLLVAPQAQSCVTDFDATVCEAGASIVLKVVGLCLVAAAAILLALRDESLERRPRRPSGRSKPSRPKASA
jgi:drug/metabolite transporter (DMT)-like permease